MKKVYAVSSGSYSDYTVDAIFETEAAAEEWAEKCNAGKSYGGYGVEEFPYFGADDEKPEVVTVFRAYAEGPDLEVRVYAMNHANYESEAQDAKGKLERRTTMRHGRRVPLIVCRSTDRERAVKVVADAVAEVKAQSAGIA